jgi:hypothetical protein
VSDEGAFGVNVCPTLRENWFKGFVDVFVKICCKVSINRAGVAEIDEFLGVSAVSWCVSLLSEGVSEFPGLGVAGSIPALFFG